MWDLVHCVCVVGLLCVHHVCVGHDIGCDITHASVVVLACVA